MSYLDVASAIGFELAADPGAAGGHWTGDCIVGLPEGGHAVEHRDCGNDLYGGSAGIGLVLAHLAVATGRDEFAEISAGALGRAVKSGLELIGGGQLSLYGGAAGIALAAVQAGSALTLDDLTGAGKELAGAVAAAAMSCAVDEVDLIGGKAGIAIALLSVDGIRPSADLRSAAAFLADELIAQSQARWWGRSAPDGSGVALCGLGHGASGIGWALIAAGNRLRREDLQRSGEEVLQFEDSQFDPVRGTWPDLRSRQANRSAEPDWMDAWCHGALGIGAVRWHLWQSGRNPLHLAKATAAMWAARRLVVQSAAADPVADMTLCHGTAGAAELMLLAFEATQLREHLNAARRAGDLILRLRERNGGRWTVGLPGGRDVPGLMLGRAGLCALFLRLHDPTAMETPLLFGSRALQRSVIQ